PWNWSRLKSPTMTSSLKRASVNKSSVVKSSVHSIVLVLALLSFGCSKPADEGGEGGASTKAGAQRPAPSQSPSDSDKEALRLSGETASATAAAAVAKSQNFPAYTDEMVKEIKSLKPGESIPVRIDRSYLILREKGGIYLAEGDYFVQLLSDPDG